MSYFILSDNLANQLLQYLERLLEIRGCAFKSEEIAAIESDVGWKCTFINGSRVCVTSTHMLPLALRANVNR